MENQRINSINLETVVEELLGILKDIRKDDTDSTGWTDEIVLAELAEALVYQASIDRQSKAAILVAERALVRALTCARDSRRGQLKRLGLGS